MKTEKERDKRLAEIRERQQRRDEQVLPDYVRPRFTSAYQDIETLLSLLQQPATSGRCGESILRSLCAEHPHIEFVEGVLGGVQPLINRHRVGVSHLLGRMVIGMPLDEYKETWGFDDETLKDAFAYVQDVIDALIDQQRGVATTGAGTERDELAAECQRRMDAVVEAAVEWRQSGREGDNTWFDKAQILSDAIDRLLELRDSPAPPAQPADEGENGSECLACGGPATDPYCVDCTERYQAMIEPGTPTTGAGARERAWRIVEGVLNEYRECSVSNGALLALVARVADALPPTEATQVAVEAAGSMMPDQLARAALIAESRSIDSETAQELVYLRDRIARLKFEFEAADRQMVEQLNKAYQQRFKAQQEASTARADTIRECVSEVADVFRSVKATYIPVNRAMEITATALELLSEESLTTKEGGDDGPTNNT